MKKSFMTRVLAVSLSAAMAFSLSSANMVTASAASTVSIAKTKTLTVGTKAKLKLKTNTLDWKIYAASSSKKNVVKLSTNTSKNYVNLNPLKAGTSTITVRVKSATRKKAGKTWKKGMTCKVTVKDEAVTPPATETSTEAATEAPTEAPTEAATEAPTEAATEAPTEAPTNPSAPAEDGWQINTLYASSRTTLEVTFSKAVDSSVTRENFTVKAKNGSQAVDVTNVLLLENGMKAVLTMSGTEMGADYTLTASGLKVSGEGQATLTGDFTTPMVNDTYIAELVVANAENNTVPAKNGANVEVTFQVRNQSGVEIAPEAINGYNVTFIANGVGDFTRRSVTVENGKATNTFRVPVLASNATAVLTAMVDGDSTNEALRGLSASTNLYLTVNQDTAATDQGVVVTNVIATTADRVIAYFNREVTADEFKKADDKTQLLGTDKLVATVQSKNDSQPQPQVLNVVDILPVEGNNRALQLLLNSPLDDNSRFKLTFIDSRYSQTTTSDPENYLVDATPPFLAYVEQDGDSLTDFIVTFSEAVLPTGKGGQNSGYNAEQTNRYTLDGVNLADTASWGTGATATIVTGSTKRHQVKIHLGKNSNGKQIYLSPGEHILEAAGIGDWAAATDGAKNIVVTNTRSFNVVGNDKAPAIKEVDIQSPEQYVVTFESVVDAVEADKAVADLFQFEYADGSNWKKFDEDVIKVRQNNNNQSQWIVELQKDWTHIWNNSTTHDNYWNHQYRLKIDAKTLENPANGKQNTSEMVINLNGTNASTVVKGSEKLEGPDGVSPRVLGVGKTTIGNATYYEISMNEPIQYKDHRRYGIAGECVVTPRQDKAIVDASVVFYNPATKQSVPADIIGTSILDDRILVQPQDSLSAGVWQVFVRSVSDDYGNTIATDTEFTITVDGTVDVAEPFKVVWAVLGNDDNCFDADGRGNFTATTGSQSQYIFIKFNKALSNRANESLCYSLNGQPLPNHSHVTRGIKGYTTKGDATGRFDSVTIELPELTKLTYYDINRAVLNITSSLTSVNGETLSNGGDILLPYNWNTVYGDGSNSTKAIKSFKELQEALNNSDYRTVKLTSAFDIGSDAGKTLTITRPVTLDLNEQTLDCNVSIKYEDTGRVDIISSQNKGNISAGRTVTIDTPNADAYIEKVDAKVINLKQVKKDTLTIKDSIIDKIDVTDSDGAGIKSEGSAEIKTIVLNTDATTTVTANGDSKIGHVQVWKTATVKLAGNSTTGIDLITTYAKDVILNNVPYKAENEDETDAESVKIGKVESSKVGEEPTYQLNGSKQDEAHTPSEAPDGSYAEALEEAFAGVKADVKAVVVSGTAATITVSGNALGVTKVDDKNKVELSITSKDTKVISFTKASANQSNEINAKREANEAKKVTITVTITVTVNGVENKYEKVIEIDPNE